MFTSKVLQKILDIKVKDLIRGMGLSGEGGRTKTAGLSKGLTSRVFGCLHLNSMDLGVNALVKIVLHFVYRIPPTTLHFLAN